MSYVLRVRKNHNWKKVIDSPIFQSALKRATRQIAVRTGFMKRTVLQYILSEMRNSPRREWVIDLSNDKIGSMISNFGVFWLGFHVRGYTRFNPKFRAGYKHPTTPDTRPIERIYMMRLLKKGIKKAQE